MPSTASATRSASRTTASAIRGLGVSPVLKTQVFGNRLCGEGHNYDTRHIHSPEGTIRTVVPRSKSCLDCGEPRRDN
jgi:hypothetical protein